VQTTKSTSAFVESALSYSCPKQMSIFRIGRIRLRQRTTGVSRHQDRCVRAILLAANSSGTTKRSPRILEGIRIVPTTKSPGNSTLKCFFSAVDVQTLTQTKDRSVELSPGQAFVVPKGVLHRPRAPERTVILMVEGAGIIPTGDK
jgi:hypothetical protein